jgi:hypothetical protein
MQLIEMAMWTDQSCTSGLNYIATTIGPLLNHFQPVVLLLVAMYFIPSAGLIPTSVIYALNVAYIIYTIYMYGKYVTASSKHKLCTRTNREGHLDWPWKHYFVYAIYLAMMVINAANYYENKFLMIALVVSFGLLYASILNYSKNVGEFWCLMVVSVPYIILFLVWLM